MYIGPNNKTGGEIYIYPNGVKEGEVVLIPPKSRSAAFLWYTIVWSCLWYIFNFPLWQNTYSYLKFDQKVKFERICIEMNRQSIYLNGGDVHGSIAFRALCFKNEKQNE